MEDDFEPAETPATAPQSPGIGPPSAIQPVDGFSLAEILGLSTRTVSALARKGVLVKVARGHYDLAASVRGYIAARTRPDGDSKDRLTAAQAELAELKLSQAKGDSLPAAEVEREWSNICRDIRAAMLAVPGRVQIRLGNLTAHDSSVIDDEIRQALAALGKDRRHEI